MGRPTYPSPRTFHDQFAADVPAPQAARMAATTRPVTRRHWRSRAGASHAVAVSNPEATAQLILEAAALPVAAA
jgi:hypothetical protein